MRKSSGTSNVGHPLIASRWSAGPAPPPAMMNCVPVVVGGQGPHHLDQGWRRVRFPSAASRRRMGRIRIGRVGLCRRGTPLCPEWVDKCVGALVSRMVGRSRMTIATSTEAARVVVCKLAFQPDPGSHCRRRGKSAAGWRRAKVPRAEPPAVAVNADDRHGARVEVRQLGQRRIGSYLGPVSGARWSE